MSPREPVVVKPAQLILGIESSCDETAAAVVRDGRTVLSNTIASQHDLHAKFGGVVPEIASRAHIERILPTIDQALHEAGVELEQIDAIAVGHRPGLIGSLLVGVAAAKALAWSLGVPLIGVDHVRAHLYAGMLEHHAADTQPAPQAPTAAGVYPALGLVVSGGHTSLYRVDGPLDMTLLGKTIDDAVGEAYDKVASILDLGFPGGPIVDRLAREGEATIDLPRSLLEPGSLDFSFSGLKTAVLYAVRGKPRGRGPDATFERDGAALDDAAKANVCASFQRAAVDVIVRKLDRARRAMVDQAAPPRSLVIGGGVSANSLLRRRATEFGQAHGLDVKLPAMAYCLDNAAMIAGLAHHPLRAGRVDDLTLEAVATTELR